jgi:DNA replication protein DnaC
MLLFKLRQKGLKMQPHEATLPLQLKELKLAAFKLNWQEKGEMAVQNSWSYSQFLSALCQLEIQRRGENRLKRHLKEANLPANKTLSGFDFQSNKQINAAQINALAETESWIKKANNVILFGPSGVGKTHIASAIAYRQIELGNPVRFFQTSHLVQVLQQSKVQFRLKERLVKLDKIPLIILDDFGYVKKDEQETSVLFELIAHRYERGSLMITANQPFSQWDTIFPDSMMAVASIDRLVHHATIINIEGESYRTRGKKGGRNE